MPLSVVSSISGSWVFGDVGSNIAGCVGYDLTATSILTLALMSLNRYICVSKHFLYLTIYTRKRVKNIFVMVHFALCTWNCLCCSRYKTHRPTGKPNLLFQAQSVIPKSTSESFIPLGSIIVIIFVLIPFLVIAVCCWKTYRVIHSHNTAAVAPALQGSISYGVEEKKITRTLVAVLLAFCACFIPAAILILLVLFGAFNKKAAVYLSFYYPIPVYISSAINPLIYSTMNKKYREEFRKLLFLK